MAKRLAVFMLAITVPAGVLLAQTNAPPATDVPVARVMLFSSGVGYFEHAGSVRGNGTTELRFKTSQINDILKSIILQDQDGGRVGTISYPSQDPLSKTLKSFQVDITQNPSLAQLLNQLRGARVTVQSQAEKLTGTILGVEITRRSAERGETIETATLNHLGCLLLARIDGKSPAEYIKEAALRERVRAFARSLIMQPPALVADVFHQSVRCAA